MPPIAKKYKPTFEDYPCPCQFLPPFAALLIRIQTRNNRGTPETFVYDSGALETNRGALPIGSGVR
jgi:hypothetical protein